MVETPLVNNNMLPIIIDVNELYDCQFLHKRLCYGFGISLFLVEVLEPSAYEAGDECSKSCSIVPLIPKCR